MGFRKVGNSDAGKAMITGYPRAFLTKANFRLAFTRIVRSTHLDYKAFYRHVFTSYNIGLEENLKALIDEVRQGTYKPTPPTIVFLPKKTGVLRPLTLLKFKDLLVYQATANVIADRMKTVQDEHAYVNAFGAIYGGPSSPWFFKSWRTGYRRFTEAVEASYHRGNVYVADFDLVSCYELIDHNLLSASIEGRVKSQEFLALLRKCLACWTTNSSGRNLRHGLPQGPEASAYLAECILFKFDTAKYNKVQYVRYIDDIKLMAKEETPLRRALLKLDLLSKDLGLVPHAQKISWSKVDRVEDITKTIPSQVVAQVETSEKGSQATLFKMLSENLVRTTTGYEIKDTTKFKYALNRLKGRISVLRKIATMLNVRPDCSFVFAEYFKNFAENEEAADMLLDSLKRDPTYDAVAANYIEAMDVCEPLDRKAAYRSVILSAEKRSIEKSILLRIAVLKFRGKREGPKYAARTLSGEKNSLIKNIVINELYGYDDKTPYKVSDCVGLFQEGVTDQDEDEDEEFARCCAFNWIYHSSITGGGFAIPSDANPAVLRLLVGLGVRKRGAKRISVLEGFFANLGIRPKITWAKALGSDLADAEGRCLRIQELRLTEPTAFVLILDTFNEVLVQSFSRRHPVLSSVYSAASGRNANPKYGSWLITMKDIKKIAVPLSSGTIAWLLEVHKSRVSGDLAHAKSETGKNTKTISFKHADKLWRRASPAWRNLLEEWQKVL